MNYSLDEFLELIERVEDQGGERLLEEHAERELVCDTGSTPQQHTSCGCGEAALFVIPYKDSRDDRARAITVCAVDDEMGRWPRFMRDAGKAVLV